jgi:hypothetical protein
MSDAVLSLMDLDAFVLLMPDANHCGSGRFLWSAGAFLSETGEAQPWSLTQYPFRTAEQQYQTPCWADGSGRLPPELDARTQGSGRFPCSAGAFLSATVVRAGGLVLRSWRSIMNRLFVATLVGLTIVAVVPTSASAFRCLAQSSNGVSTWGRSLIAARAQRFAVRHCRYCGRNRLSCRLLSVTL